MIVNREHFHNDRIGQKYAIWGPDSLVIDIGDAVDGGALVPDPIRRLSPTLIVLYDDYAVIQLHLGPRGLSVWAGDSNRVPPSAECLTNGLWLTVR